MGSRASQTKKKKQKSMESCSGNLFILSAPSGAGKTTLCREILKQFPNIRYSISHTTRPPRPGERNGIDYFFISVKAFLKGIQNGSWAEWAKVHDHYYGTSMGFLKETLLSGSDVLLDIDVQGAIQIMKKYPDAVSIFILPPSMETLQVRLYERGTDPKEVIEKRLRNAKTEMDRKDVYQHIVINDRLEDARQELFQIINRYSNN
jgi:guanylate kinase